MTQWKFPITDRAIREANKKESIRTLQARKIVRKGLDREVAGGDTGGHIIEDEGIILPNRTYLNFKGAAVVAEDDEVNDATNVRVSTLGSGGGGGGGGDDSFSPTVYRLQCNPSSVSAGVVNFTSATVGVPYASTGEGTSVVELNELDHFVVPLTAAYDVRLHAVINGPVFSGGGASDIATVQVEQHDFSVLSYWTFDVRNPAGASGNFQGYNARILVLQEGAELYLRFSSLNGYTYLSPQFFVELHQLSYATDAGADPGGGITFTMAAPGLLTEEGGEYFMDWKAADEHHNYTKGEVEALITAYLGSSQSWEQAGITVRKTDTAPVTFQVVAEATCDTPELACTHHDQFGPGTAYVELEYMHLNRLVYPGIGPGNLINHEAGHAYFGAEHTGGGIMADFDNNRSEFPTDNDILSVSDWLFP